MKSVYLAAAFHRKEEMKDISLKIAALGVEITSRWLDEEPAPAGPIKLKRFLLDTADMDAADVKRAHTLIRFSDDLSTPTVPSGWCTAARMEETGMAHAWGKQIIIVGGIQSLFDRFPQRVHVKDVDALLAYIKKGGLK
jgi:hypothetical protein